MLLQRSRFNRSRPACGNTRSRARASSISSWRTDEPCGEKNERRLRRAPSSQPERGSIGNADSSSPWIGGMSSSSSSRARAASMARPSVPAALSPRWINRSAAHHDDQHCARLAPRHPLDHGAAGTGGRRGGGARGAGLGAGFRDWCLMFENVSRYIESGTCCHWEPPSLICAPHARNGAISGSGPV